MKTHKMEYDMVNADWTMTKEYEEYVEYEEYEEFDTKGYITSIGEVFVPGLWTRGGCNQNEFQAFKHQWSMYRGCHSGMDERELRYQLLDSINGPLEDAMNEIFGSNFYTIPDIILLEELEEVAVKEIIAKSVNCSTKFSEKNPVKLPPVNRSPAHSSQAHSKSKKIVVKQPEDTAPEEHAPKDRVSEAKG